MQRECVSIEEKSASLVLAHRLNQHQMCHVNILTETALTAAGGALTVFAVQSGGV